MPGSVIRLLTAILLIGGMVICWNREYRPAKNLPQIALSGPTPPLLAGLEAHRLPLGSFGAADGIQLEWALQPKSLQRGELHWETGRLHLEWLREGKTVERIFLAGARGDETASRGAVILESIPPNATAELHIENLGISGTLQLARFEATPVQHSPAAKRGLILIGMGWLFWAASLAGSMRCFSSWLAGGLWLAAAYFLVVPGPWQLRTPLGPGQDMTAPDAAESMLTPQDVFLADTQPGAIESPNLLLRWKLRLQAIRPLLHGLLFLVPTLGLLILTQNERRGLILAALLALGAEAAQWGFGYGFDWTDVIDLATDAVGIASALWVFRKWGRRQSRTARE